GCYLPGFHFSKTVICKNKGDTGFGSRIIIALCIAYIYRRGEPVIVNNILNVFGFGISFSAVALVPAKIVAHITQFQEYLDIAALAVAYDKQLVFTSQVT